MNKLDFLRRLDRELSPLDQAERRELIAFYEERFYNGTIYENKTEEQVVAELESPEVIGRNILSEYGISVKESKRQASQPQFSGNNNGVNQQFQKQRSNQIVTSSLVVLILVDVFLLSWAIPTLFGIVTSIGGSLLSYIGVLSFLSSDVIYDQMIFWFLTGAYILLLQFFFVVVEFFLWVCKRTIIWHMKVLRFKKVNDWNKRLARVSVEGWFKRHRFLRFVKNISGVAALIVMAYTGFYLYGHYDEINELYLEQEVLTDVQTLEVSDDITNAEIWSIISEIDSMDVTVIPTVGDEIIVTRTYKSNDEATYSATIDDTNNLVNINHDVPNQIVNWGLSLEQILSFIQRDSLVIEVPQDLLIEDIDLEVTDGKIELNGFELSGYLSVDGENGSITLRNMVVALDVTLDSSNAVISVNEVDGADKLVAKTSNGKIIIKNTSFKTYDLDTSNGKVVLEDLNVELKDGVSLNVHSSNGALEFENVYVADVYARTTNGDIDYYNDDESFDVDFDRNTSNGEISTNVN